MRPRSIIQFERLYLVSLVIVVIQQVFGFFIARDLFGRMPTGSDMPGMNGFFSGLMIGSMLFGLLLAVGVPLLLWWLAARKRTEVAKWLLVVISVLSVLMWLTSMVMLFAMPMPSEGVFEGFRSMQLAIVAIDGTAEIFGVVALWYLFRPDATQWFRTAGPHVDSEVFR